MRISDWSSDVRSSDLAAAEKRDGYFRPDPGDPAAVQRALFEIADLVGEFDKPRYVQYRGEICTHSRSRKTGCTRCLDVCPTGAITSAGDIVDRSEEHTSELQSLMRNSYAVFCLKKKTKINHIKPQTNKNQ